MIPTGEKHGTVTVLWKGIGYEVSKVGSWKSTFFSGEGLVCDLTGPGRIYLQTRSQDAFLGWLIPKLPKPSNGGGGFNLGD